MRLSGRHREHEVSPLSPAVQEEPAGASTLEILQRDTGFGERLGRSASERG